jgi:hypothetical protein
MTCRACGATIAAKAIVCYKCGTPTEDHVAVSRQPAGRSRPVARLLAAGTAITALAVWLIPMTPADSWQRWAAWAAVPVVTFITVRLIRGPRLSTLRRK